jgi:hypothetical protein
MRLRPQLVICEGGEGCLIGVVARAYLHYWTGFLPPFTRWLLLDFKSDPPVPPVRQFSRALPATVWDRTALGRHEFSGFGAEVEFRVLAERVNRGDPDAMWIGKIAYAPALACHNSHEAQGRPLFGRTELLLDAQRVDPLAGPTWFEDLGQAYRDAAPGGRLWAEFLREGTVGIEAEQTFTDVWHVFGSSGGCGAGVYIPVAAAGQHFAREFGLRVHNRAMVITGDYHDEQRDRHEKRSVAQSCCLDLAMVQDPDLSIEVPVGPRDVIRAKGPLFNDIYVHDAVTPSLQHREYDVVASGARALAFLLASEASAEFERVRTNTRVQTPAHLPLPFSGGEAFNQLPGGGNR